MKRLLAWLGDYLLRRASRTPYFHLPGYMLRYWFVPYNRVIRRIREDGTATADGTGPVCWWRRPIARLLQLCGIAIRVHAIMRSDKERHPHDHPWPYVTVILRGGYYETRYDDRGLIIDYQWHGPGSILIRPANSWHRLDLRSGADPTLTLFITGRKAQTWGFLTPDGKVPYWDYHGS